MATKRVQRRRRTRRRGGVFGIASLKTDAENIQNCIKYWKQTPKYCNQNAKISRTPGSSYMNFPGFIKQGIGVKPTIVYNRQDGTQTEKPLSPWLPQ